MSERYMWEISGEVSVNVVVCWGLGEDHFFMQELDRRK